MSDTKPKRGRPQKSLDWPQFEKLCALQCTQTEIASFFGVHKNTIRERVQDEYKEDYCTIYKRFSDSGKCSLRRHQFVLSRTNASMAIWLGKMWLGQREQNDQAKEIIDTFIALLKSGKMVEAKEKLVQVA